MLFLMPAAERAGLEANVRLQQQEGVQVEIVDGDTLRELEPRGRFDDVIAAWEPEAGSVDPVRTVGAFGAEAIRLGVDIQLGCEVVSVLADSDGAGLRVGGVETSLGRIATRAVVAATGPWSLRLLASLGIDMPLEVVRPQQAFLRPPPTSATTTRSSPTCRTTCTSNPRAAVHASDASATTRTSASIPITTTRERAANSWWMHGRASRIACRPMRGQSFGAAAVVCIPSRRMARRSSVRSPASKAFWLVTGFSGHGFKLSPAVGRGVAELLVHGSSRHLDLDFFDPERFRRKLAHASGYRFKILG
jgi:glycine/D-amino acid oxidase-like deaminating enzyme